MDTLEAQSFKPIEPTWRRLCAGLGVHQLEAFPAHGVRGSLGILPAVALGDSFPVVAVRDDGGVEVLRLVKRPASGFGFDQRQLRVAMNALGLAQDLRVRQHVEAMSALLHHGAPVLPILGHHRAHVVHLQRRPFVVRRLLLRFVGGKHFVLLGFWRCVGEGVGGWDWTWVDLVWVERWRGW